MKSKLFRGPGIIVAIVLFVFALNVFAIETDKGLTLDDGSGDSPQVIIKDGDDNTLTLQKMDAGEADIINNEGDINLKPSGDTDDYLKVLTTGDASYLYWLGILAYTNNPGLRVNPATGRLEYRDEDSAAWVSFDAISGGSTTFGGLSDTSFGGGPVQGDVAYFNGTNWVNLGAGTSGEFLQTQGAAANPQWFDAGGGDITAVGDVATGDAFTTGGSGSVLYFQGTTSGQLTVTAPAAAGTNTITLPAATDTLVGKATTDTLTNKTLTSAVLNTGVSGTAIKDEDNMTADSATHLATQQSIKAYVDTQVVGGDFADNTFTVYDDGDNTKILALETSGISTGTTRTLTVPNYDGTIATVAGTETLTNKTLTSPMISSISNTGTLTLPTSTDTLVGRDTTDTLTNKTLTSPTIGTSPTAAGATWTDLGSVTTVDINGGTIDGATITSPVLNTGVSGTAVDTDDTFASASDTVLASQLAIKTYVDSQTVAGDFDDSTFTVYDDGDNTKILALETSGITTGTTRTLTVPNYDGTIATIAGTETLTNKTLTSPTIGTSPTAAGATWTDLGTVTTVDINGGTIDGATITSPVLNTGVSGTAVDTDDTFASASDTVLASQLAIKTYVDSQDHSGGGAFSSGANLIYAGDSDDDFVFGSTQLDDAGDANKNARMFFDKSKAAFRAGKVTGTEWNDVNVGFYSTAIGYGTTARGAFSTAMGGSTTASGERSTAMGGSTTASGGFSTAMGGGTTASGDYSAAMGSSTTTSGAYSVAMGLSTTAQAYASLTIGRYNTVTGATGSWVATDPAFVIGNGANSGALADAFTVFKDGNVTMAGTMSLKEQASANGDTVAYGQLWVKTENPNQLWFTDDAGTDVQLGAGGGGDITAVGDVTTGAAFTSGGSGSILYFQGTSSGQLTVTAPAAAGANTITFPATTGTVITTGDSGTVDSTMIATDTILAGDIASNAVETAEILDNTITATDLNATLTFADGDLLDLSGITANSTTEGLKLPAYNAAAQADGQITWDAGTDKLYVGNNGGVTEMGDITSVTAGDGLGTGGTSGDVTLILNVDDSTVEVNADTLRVKDAGITEDKLAASLVFDSTDVLNLAAVGDTNAKGLILPQKTGGAPSNSTAEGQIIWDSDNDALYVGTSSGVTQIGSGGGDITAVGDVSTGAAFTSGGSGSILYFQGTSSGQLTVTAPAAAGANTITFPATTGTVITTGDSGTVDSTMIATDTILAGDIASNAVETAEILDNTITATDLNATLTFADGDLLDLSGITANSTTEGLKLPAYNAAAQADGQITWDAGTDKLYVGNNGGVTEMGDITSVTAGDGLGTGGTSGDVTLILNVDDSTVEVNADTLRVKDAGITEDKLAASLVFDSTDVLNLAAVGDTNGDGLILPQKAGVPAVGVTEGQIVWDSSGNKLYVGNGTGLTEIGAGSGISNVVEDTTPQLGGNLDVNGKFIGGANSLELIKFVETANAENEITITNAAYTFSPIIASTGQEASIDLSLVAKGTGVVLADGVEVVTVTNDQILTNKTLTAPKFANGGYIADANDNESLVFATTTNAVNEIKLTNAVSGDSPKISATGDSSNVSLILDSKGTGKIAIANDGTTAYSLPNADGGANEILKTDGSGVVSWATDATGGSSLTVTTISSNTTLSTANQFVLITGGSSTTVTLPASPATGQILYLYASPNTAKLGINSKTVYIAGGTHADGDPFSYMSDAAAIMIYNGTAWYVVAAW